MQTGIVLDVKRDVDVVLNTGEVLEHQSSSCLQPNILYQPGQHVLHKDGWFGRTDEVQRCLCAGHLIYLLCYNMMNFHVRTAAEPIKAVCGRGRSLSSSQWRLTAGL